MKSKAVKIILIFVAIFTCIGTGSIYVHGKSRKARGKSLTNPHKYFAQSTPKAAAPLTQIATTEEEPKNEINKNQTTDLKETPKVVTKKKEEEVIDKQEEKLEQTTPIEEEEEIYLNFENAKLINFINYIADLKKINVLIEGNLIKHKISLTIRNPITKEQAWKILLSITEMSGFSIIKVGDLYKVIPKDKKLIQPLPVYINVDPATLPESDINIRYVYFLTNIKVGDVLGWVNNMLGAPHIAIANESNNGLILTDKSFNIKSIMKIVKELDKSGLKESVRVLNLRDANATEVRDLLNSLIEGQRQPPQITRLHLLLGRKFQDTASSYFAKGTKIIAEERTNSLILLGSNETTQKIENFIKEHIDIKLKGVESPLHIYELQYTDAKQMVELLNMVLVQPESIAGAQASEHGAVRGGVKYFKKMTLQADNEGNRIIASSTDKQDWKLLKQTIQNLDKPQPEVAIETLIVTVAANDSKELGGQARNKKHGQLGRWVDAQTTPLVSTVKSTNPATLLGNLITGLQGGLGSTVLSFGRANNIWGIFKILNSHTHASVIAKPFLSVANKYTASIKIGEIRMRDSETAYDTQGNPVIGKKEKAADLEVRVKPQINMDGIINLDIKVDYNDFTRPDSADFEQIRKLQTNVSVANGQVLALGGLVKTKTTNNTYKTPVLGNIPVLGWLFKHKEKTKEKENVLIFICPTIIKPRRYGMNLYTRMKIDEAKDIVEEAIPTHKTHDPIYNWFFDTKGKEYANKIDDFSSARFQPATVDIEDDPYYRTKTRREIEAEEKSEETLPLRSNEQKEIKVVAQNKKVQEGSK